MNFCCGMRVANLVFTWRCFTVYFLHLFVKSLVVSLSTVLDLSSCKPAALSGLDLTPIWWFSLAQVCFVSLCCMCCELWVFFCRELSSCSHRSCWRMCRSLKVYGPCWSRLVSLQQTFGPSSSFLSLPPSGGGSTCDGAQ